MLLWVTFALLATAVATMLMRSPREPSSTTAHDPDLDVYRDQLAELTADVERGVVSPAEATSARSEIARRLLKHADKPGLPSSQQGNADIAPPKAAASSSERVLFAGAAAIPIACLAIYLVLGSPSLPGRPLAERLAKAPDAASADDLILKVEARLREKPDDGMGWSVIAPVYLSQGRLVDAGQAYERAIALLGETPERLAGLAKALVLANNGLIVEPARRAYERLLVLDPKRVEAKFWLAIHDEQNGRAGAAEATYRKLLSDAPADAPWKPAVEARLAALLGKPGQQSQPSPNASAPQLPVASGSAPSGAPVLSPAGGVKAPGAGPTPAEFVAAAQGLPVEVREQMIGRMVARSGDAIKQNGKDLSAWSRLVTGYRALGKSSEAAAALKQAREAFAGDQGSLAELDALGASLGLAS
jgi:cytochrome c-type biogenesis protein CcmH